MPTETKHTPSVPESLTLRDVAGSGIEILAPLEGIQKFVKLPKGMPANVFLFTMVGPQNVPIACERWVQFEPDGWHEMQLKMGQALIDRYNAFPTLAAENAELVKALELIAHATSDAHGDGAHHESAFQIASEALAARKLGGKA